MDALSPVLELTRDRLVAEFGAAVSPQPPHRGELTVEVAVERLLDVLHFLREDDTLAYCFLTDVTAVDRLPAEPRFAVVYHLLSLATGSRLRLKALVGLGQAVPTVTGLWAGANYPEREVYDLFGIPFRGHPNLRRLVTPDGFEGHPLRKDYDIGSEPVAFDIPHRKRFGDAAN